MIFLRNVENVGIGIEKNFILVLVFFYSGEKINIKDVIVIIIKILWKEDMF